MTDAEAAVFGKFVGWVFLSIVASYILWFLYTALSQLAHYYRMRCNGPYEELIEARKKLKTTEGAYRRLLSEHEGCFSQISAAEDAYSALSSRHQALTASFAELKRRMDEEKAKREQLKKVHRVELREAASRAESAERKIDALRINYDKLLSKLGQRNADEVESRRKTENLVKKLKKKHDTEEKLSFVVTELEQFKVYALRVIDEQKAKLRNRNAMIESLKASCESKESVIRQARQDMLRYKLQRDKAVDEGRQRDEELSSKLRSVPQSEESADRLSNRIAFLEALNNQLEWELNKLAKVNCALLKEAQNCVTI